MKLSYRTKEAKERANLHRRDVRYKAIANSKYFNDGEPDYKTSKQIRSQSSLSQPCVFDQESNVVPQNNSFAENNDSNADSYVDNKKPPNEETSKANQLENSGFIQPNDTSLFFYFF